MEERAAALRAARHVFRMLARLLLRVGVPSRDAERALREAFVETASLEFGLRGRPTNLSRVAMLTGLDRREVARVRARLDARSPEAGDESHPLGQVLAGWYEDPDFSGADGPRALALEAVGGDGRAGLPQLFSRYAPGLPPVAVRKELERAGALELVDGLAVARSRHYLLAGLSPRSIDRYGAVVTDLLRTINHNVLADEPSRPRFEGRAQHAGVDARTAEGLRRFLDARGQAFLEEIDSWMSARAGEAGDVRIGVGLYMIHDQTRESS